MMLKTQILFATSVAAVNVGSPPMGPLVVKMMLKTQILFATSVAAVNVGSPTTAAADPAEV